VRGGREGGAGTAVPPPPYAKVEGTHPPGMRKGAAEGEGGFRPGVRPALPFRRAVTKPVFWGVATGRKKAFAFQVREAVWKTFPPYSRS